MPRPLFIAAPSHGLVVQSRRPLFAFGCGREQTPRPQAQPSRPWLTSGAENHGRARTLILQCRAWGQLRLASRASLSASAGTDQNTHTACACTKQAPALTAARTQAEACKAAAKNTRQQLSPKQEVPMKVQQQMCMHSRWTRQTQPQTRGNRTARFVSTSLVSRDTVNAERDWTQVNKANEHKSNKNEPIQLRTRFRVAWPMTNRSSTRKPRELENTARTRGVRKMCRTDEAAGDVKTGRVSRGPPGPEGLGNQVKVPQ